MRGWSNYFKHAVAKHTMSSLENFVWHRVIRTAGDGRTSADTTLAATAAGCDPWRMGSSCSTSARSRSRDTGVAAPRSPTPGSWPTPPDGRHTVESPLRGNSHGAFGERPGGNGPTATSAPRPRPTQPSPSTCPQISDAAVSSRCLRRYGRNGVLPVPIVVGLAGLDCACLNTYSAAYPRCRDLNRSIQVVQVL
jgi:hypothetical protein